MWRFLMITDASVRKADFSRHREKEVHRKRTIYVPHVVGEKMSKKQVNTRLAVFVLYDPAARQVFAVNPHKEKTHISGLDLIESAKGLLASLEERRIISHPELDSVKEIHVDGLLECVFEGVKYYFFYSKVGYTSSHRSRTVIPFSEKKNPRLSPVAKWTIMAAEEALKMSA